jgi:hypothetical protein
MSAAEPRTLTLELPASWSINQLIRASYHLRNSRREMLKAKILGQMEAHGYTTVTTQEKGAKKVRKVGPDWKPFRFLRADALIGSAKFRDNFELPASLKIEFDALQETGVIATDGPEALERGIVSQCSDRGNFVRIRLVELAAAPKQPQLDI